MTAPYLTPNQKRTLIAWLDVLPGGPVPSSPSTIRCLVHLGLMRFGGKGSRFTHASLTPQGRALAGRLALEEASLRS